MARLFGICGGSGAGKTTLTAHVARRLGDDRMSTLAFDAYYHCHGHLSPAARSRVNYDHPDSLDVELFAAHLDDLRRGRPVDAPEYDFATHTRTRASVRVEAREVVVVEGILLFAFSEIRELLDHTVFIDVPEPVRLERRIRRDVAERGREPDDVRRQFAATVAPMHDEHVQPHRERADRVVAHGEDLGAVAAELTRLVDPDPAPAPASASTITASTVAAATDDIIDLTDRAGTADRPATTGQTGTNAPTVSTWDVPGKRSTTVMRRSP